MSQAVPLSGGVGVDALDSEPIDLALAAHRLGGHWYVSELGDDVLESVETIAVALRRLPSDVGAVAMLTVDEDFFILVRADALETRVLLSDVAAADDWDLADDVLDFLGLPAPGDDEYGPAGDLTLLADLGLHPADLEAILEDDELFPDEMLSDIAAKVGFGPAFDEAADLDQD